MPTPNPFAQLDQRMVGDIYTSNAVMETLEVLCDECGARFAGTPQEKQAVDYIGATFQRHGLSQAHLEPFTYAGWSRGQTSLAVLEPVERSLDCISLPYCPAAEIEAELVSVGCGSPAEYATLGQGGNKRIVMAGSASPPDLGRWVHRQEKYNRAVLSGAAVFLFISELPGVGPETGSLQSDQAAPIPGVSVCKEDGAFLERLLAKNGRVKLRLSTTDTNQSSTSWNAVADLPGKTHPEEMVVLGCHYDGHDISQGAIDPASGMAVVLEAARVLSQHAGDALERTVRFIAYGCEEIGLTGSYRYVDAHADEMDNIRFVLNLDACGGAGRKGVILHRWPELEPFFRQAGKEMAWDLPLGHNVNAYSDHFPFFMQGVPTGGMGDAESGPQGRGFGHTRYDTLDKVQLSDLRNASGVAARLALRLANAAAADFPAQRRDAAAVAELVATEPDMEGHRVAQQLKKELGKPS